MLADNSTPGEIVLNGDLHGSNDPLQPEITPTGVTPGVYNFPNIVVNSKGQILSIEEYAAEDVPCATKVSCGIVKIGDNLTDAGNGIVDFITADATTISKGIVQIGSGFAVTNGILSIDIDPATEVLLGTVQVPVNGNLGIDGVGNLTIDIATDLLVGVVQVPGGDGLVVDVSGNLTFDSSGISDATTISNGVVQVGTNIDVTSGIISVADATNADKGVVQVGTNLNEAAGVISNDIATETSLGVVTVGTGLVIDVSGNLTVDASLIPDATTSSKGKVQIGTNMDVAAGVVTVADATNADKGVVQVDDTIGLTFAGSILDIKTATNSILGTIQVPGGDGLAVDVSGNLTFDSSAISNATTISKGVVQIGTNIDVAAGVMSIADATNVVKGVIKNGNYFSLVAGEIDVDANVNKIDAANIWSGTLSTIMPILDNSSTIDGSISNFFEIDLVPVVFVPMTYELPLIVNPVVGTTYDFIINVNGFDVTFDPVYKLHGTTVPDKITVVTCVCISPTEFLTIVQPNFQ